MKILRTIIYASNPKLLSEFYCLNLGLKSLESIDDTWFLVGDGQAEIGFHQAYDELGKILVPTGSEKHPHKISFLNEEVENIYNEFKKKNIKVTDLKNFDGWKMFTAYDLENHAFQITNR